MKEENTDSANHDARTVTIEPVDKKVLDNLRELMEEEFLELIDLFLKSVPIQLGTLKEAIYKKDTSGIYRTAHSLKTSCSNLGANVLTPLCKSLEMSGRAGKIEGGVAAIKKIEEEFERVKVFLELEVKKITEMQSDSPRLAISRQNFGKQK